MATLEEEIRQSVTDVLNDSSKCSIVGQGLFQPRYLTMQQAKGSVTAALLEHEPRINVTRVDVVPAQDIGVEIYLKYSIKEEVIMTELEELTQRVIVLESSVTALQTDVSTNQTDITALQTDVSTNQTDILTLDSRLDTAEASQITANDAIAALEGRVTTLETNVTALEAFRDNQGMLVAYHTENVGTNGGSPIGGIDTWAIVPINTITESSGSLTGLTVDQIANEITVPPGTYKIRAEVYGCGVKRFQSGIIANDTIIAKGQSVGSSADAFAVGLTLSQVSVVETRKTFTVATRIRLSGIYAYYHQFGASLGVAVYGTGDAQINPAQGTEERYSSLVIERVG